MVICTSWLIASPAKAAGKQVTAHEGT